ncbi:hypothetical protein [Methyloglobulus sp.]|uniref:hypothetical protein n=1 Tax=Methyloglobulus sp. TaxID=2518622 RepID=UPI0032B709D6
MNVQLFQDQQAHHQANEIGWPALALGVMFGKGAVQFEPGDNLCHPQQWIAGIELQQQVDAKEVGLVACA